jgi:DNA-binding NarL/FixJ family response regulator
MPKLRILIADDHAIVREGIRALLSAADDLEVVGEAADGQQAIDQYAALRPDVVLMDIAMPGLGGLEATTAIRREDPAARIIVLTQYEDAEYLHRFLRAGVSGYVLKRAAGSELVSAVRAACRGGLVLDPRVARAAVQDARGAVDPRAPSPYETLTDREKQVLKLLAEGNSNKDVARALDISLKTAMSHREHLMRKLDLHNRTELVRFAIREGVIRAEL